MAFKGDENLARAACMADGVPIFEKRGFSKNLALTIFLFLGVLQTFIAYFIFDRTYDHSYFASLANIGPSVVDESGLAWYDFKSKAIAYVFYFSTTFSRLLGGDDFLHVLWLRILCLLSFVCAYDAIEQFFLNRYECDDKVLGNARKTFMILCLLYPGQLAWTASLLRDGLACAFLFYAIWSWARKRWILLFLFTAASLSLRPEFLIFMVMMAVISSQFGMRTIGKRRILSLLLLILGIAFFGYWPRAPIAEFSEATYMEASYPIIHGIFDIEGFVNVVLQGALDPISLIDLSTATLFKVADVIFFISIVFYSFVELRRCNLYLAALIIATIGSMWVFAYFEVYVSGFSRHRMGLVILLLAVISLSIRERSIRESASV